MVPHQSKKCFGILQETGNKNNIGSSHLFHKTDRKKKQVHVLFLCSNAALIVIVHDIKHMFNLFISEFFFPVSAFLSP